MEKKILFVDLDGTLLDDNKDITPGNLEAIQKATEAGTCRGSHHRPPLIQHHLSSWRSFTWTSPAAMPSPPTAR